MGKVYQVPGVYPEEKRVFGKTVVSKVTAVPVFIGYTQKKPEVPKRINSFEEYFNEFGGGYYDLDASSDFVKKFFLFESIKLFYANGGQTCYVMSVGEYEGSEPDAVTLKGGINKIFEIPEGNLVLLPDAAGMKGEDRKKVYKELLKKCSPGEAFINQFAILDAKKDLKEQNEEEALNGLEGKVLAHGAMYHPWVKTNLLTRDDVERSLRIPAIEKYEAAKKEVDAATEKYEAAKNAADAATRKYDEVKHDAAKKDKAEEAKNKAEEAKNKAEEAKNTAVRNLEKAKGDMAERRNDPERDVKIKKIIEANSSLPPGGAIAGAFVRNDERFGIQKAPANIALNGIKELLSPVNDTNQGGFNVPKDGKSINCIRAFINNDIKIWGARTLDGNDDDFRYVNVRRTMSMLQESIKNLLEQFVFDDNNERTWLKIRAALGKFLRGMLYRGVLYGNTPSEAYEFSVGLGQTMTEDDLLNGFIRVHVKLALIRPAEFIVVTFEQKTMEGVTAVASNVAASDN